MKFCSDVISIFLLVLLIYGLCPADTIVLKQGQSLTGEILAEKDTMLYVDIGVTVLTIPKEKILEYEYTAAPQQQDIDVNDIAADAGQSHRPVGLL